MFISNNPSINHPIRKLVRHLSTQPKKQVLQTVMWSIPLVQIDGRWQQLISSSGCGRYTESQGYS